jgi:hypothetical protein
MRSSERKRTPAERGAQPLWSLLTLRSSTRLHLCTGPLGRAERGLVPPLRGQPGLGGGGRKTGGEAGADRSSQQSQRSELLPRKHITRAARTGDVEEPSSGPRGGLEKKAGSGLWPRPTLRKLLG